MEKESLLLYYLGEASLYLKRTIIFDHVKNLFKNLASDKHVTQMQDLSVLLHIDSHSLESILAQFFVARKCAGFIDSVKGEVTLFKLECLR